MKFIGTQDIDLKRLYLRKFNLNDYEDVFEYASNPNVTRYLTWNAYTNKEDSLEYLKSVASIYNEKTFRWEIVLKSNDKVIGSIDAVKIDEVNETVEIGYVENEKYHNNGYMSEAFKGVIDYFFNKVGVKKVLARYQIENLASRKVMDKCGLKPENKEAEKILPLKNNKKVIEVYMGISRK